MKIKCNHNDLLNSVNIVLKAVSTKTSMPILESIVIDATDEFIKLISNDMELGIETILKGKILEKGSIAIDAKMFSDYVRKLPDNEVTITVKEDNIIEITCEKSKININGNKTEDFPYLPNIEREKYIEISQFSLKEIIRQTVFSISDNENNKIMTGELFEISENNLRLVALDGHRIAIRKIELKDNNERENIIVPGKTLIEISKILSGDAEDFVKIYIKEKHILFEFNETIVLSRLIEGEFYKIDQMLSSDYETKIRINKKNLQDSIDRALLLIKEKEKKSIIFYISDNVLEMKVNTEVATLNEKIDIELEGKDIIIGFNPKFIFDALKVIEDEEIEIYLINSKAPCFIKNKEESYIYLIVPININV